MNLIHLKSEECVRWFEIFLNLMPGFITHKEVSNQPLELYLAAAIKQN